MGPVIILLTPVLLGINGGGSGGGTKGDMFEGSPLPTKVSSLTREEAN